MQDQQVCLDALAVFDDNQNGMESRQFSLVRSLFCLFDYKSGSIDRARFRQLLTGTGSGLASVEEVDSFLRLLPQGSDVSFKHICEVFFRNKKLHRSYY